MSHAVSLCGTARRFGERTAGVLGVRLHEGFRARG